MTFIVILPLASLISAVQLPPGGEEFHFSALQISGVSILGIVLAISFFMHRLVLNWIDRGDLPGGLANGSAHTNTIVRYACPSAAAGNLQGGRWTKDRCGGDQQWRPRLSGRGWTDRRRSG